MNIFYNWFKNIYDYNILESHERKDRATYKESTKTQYYYSENNKTYSRLQNNNKHTVKNKLSKHTFFLEHKHTHI